MREQMTDFVRIDPDSGRTAVTRAVAIEAPLAIEINGIGYAVMMTTPDELVDFAHGFVWSERLVDAADEIVSVDHDPSEQGHRLRIQISPVRTERLLERFRHRVSDSSCGICGIENLEQGMRPLPAVPQVPEIGERAVFRALDALRDWQPLNTATGAAHAAAHCAVDGRIIDVREDIGRHN